jgi:hypothetical protein
MGWIDEAATCLEGNLPAGSRMIVFGSQANFRGWAIIPTHEKCGNCQFA